MRHTSSGVSSSLRAGTAYVRHPEFHSGYRIHASALASGSGDASLGERDLSKDIRGYDSTRSREGTSDQRGHAANTTGGDPHYF